MVKIINSFSGENAFLSNFYPCSISYQGIEYPSTEHLYQALKSLDRAERAWVSEAPNPAQAKRRGRQLVLREGWVELNIREKVMTLALRLKFPDRRTELVTRLLGTRPALLVEGNNHNDTYWGVCKGKGLNRLGVRLVQRRERLWKVLNAC